MNNKAIETLEFNKIKEILKSYAITYIGKQKVDDLNPSTSKLEIQRWQDETHEAYNYIMSLQNIPISPISNIDNILNKLNIGGILTIKELLLVSDILRVSRKLKSSFSGKDENFSAYPILSDYFDSLYTNQKVEQEIERCIKNEEELDDRASQELYKIRKSINDEQSKIKDKLNAILKSHGKYLQDQVITIRDDRYVIPVKTEYKNEVNGLIHDQSATGNTLFIEPTSIFNINNEIKELKLKEQAEIQRILNLLTQICIPLIEQLNLSIDNIGNIDFAFAKGQYAYSLNAIMPDFSEKYIDLQNARHPLIDENKVVPISIWIGKDFTTLVITGPNTGGKTVTLKTVGLLSLMAQSGLHIPAKEGSCIKVFDNIYTDIGDEQSIEQSLSTFSAHMTNLVNILNDFTDDDLILIDEIGSGTDPVEGAAIAMSILEYLHNSKALAIATTHYSELKTFAMEKEGIENASCEFDVETLMPTYKLLIGVPGRSNAFAISKKLGLKEEILSRANEFLSEETIKFEDVLSNMELDRKKAQEERELSKKLLKEAENVKLKAEEENAKIEKKKYEILTKAKEEARELLKDADNEAKEIINELTKIKKENSKESGKKAEQERAKLKKSLSDLQNDLIEPQDIPLSNPIAKKDIKVGMQVYVPSLEQDVTVLKLPDKNDDVMVQSGIIKLKIHISKMEKSKETENTKKTKLYSSKSVNKTLDISTEINIIGMTVDEALPVLEKYIDDAYLSNVAQIRIVHGKGTGILRKAVQNYLSKHPHIKSYRQGLYGEGDLGVTVAELK